MYFVLVGAGTTSIQVGMFMIGANATRVGEDASTSSIDVAMVDPYVGKG